MRYDISKAAATKMPAHGKDTKCIKILLSQVSKDMREPPVPMLFPILGEHVSGSEFQYPGQKHGHCLSQTRPEFLPNRLPDFRQHHRQRQQRR